MGSERLSVVLLEPGRLGCCFGFDSGLVALDWELLGFWVESVTARSHPHGDGTVTLINHNKHHILSQKFWHGKA